MRVLLVSAEYPPTPGGIGDYTALLASHLAAAGATVAVLTSGEGGTRQEGPVTVFPIVRQWGWGIARTVREIVATVRPDVLNVQYQTGMYRMHPAINLLPCRMPFARGDIYRYVPEEQLRPWFVATFHDTLPPYLFPKVGPLRTHVNYLLARESDAVIATNGTDHAKLAQWNTHTSLVPIGSNIPAADAVDSDAIRARFGIPADAFLLTTFGLLNQSKGLAILIDALALLCAAGVRAHLLLVGAGAGASDPTNARTAAAFDALCVAAGVAASVSRTGPLPADQVAQALAASDGCLLPYRDGASPRRGSLLAALAQGVPVVTTQPAPHVYDGLPDLHDGNAALLVPPDDPTALANAVLTVIGDQALAARMRMDARAYAAHFVWPEIARQTLAVYQRVGASEMKEAAGVAR